MTKREGEEMISAVAEPFDASQTEDGLTEAELSYMASIMLAKGKSTEQVHDFLAQQGAPKNQLQDLVQQGDALKKTEFRKSGQVRMLFAAVLIAIAAVLFCMESDQVNSTGLLLLSICFGVLGIYLFAKGLIRAVLS